MNNYNRKDFLKLALGTSGALLAQNSFASFLEEENSKKIKQFGIQLWSVREAMEKDPEAVLKQLAGYGYKQIESFGGGKGIFWGMKNTEYKQVLDDYGLTMLTSHCGDTGADLEKRAAEAAEIGVKYLVYPWEGADKTIEDYKKMADEFNKNGEVCRKNGIKYAFHNHDYSFKKINGEFPQDVLMKNTEASLVDYQMDIYWVVTAGQNPEEWIRKYPNRFVSSHVKDRSKGATGTDASCILGTGSINFARVLKTAKKYGMKYFNVEQEKWEAGTPLQCAEKNAAYLKKLKI